ncbi:MAG: YkgJ family cysteine cluster protein [Planctomycetota bacterium]|jgi:Fe-S-cluster containining protein
MVAGCGTDSRLLKRVTEIYDWLDLQIDQSNDLVGVCKSCGSCCDFDTFDHRLFVTSPELMYFAASLGVENVKAMSTGRCPYNIDGKCSIYEHRFAGCRIFSCNGDADFQSELSESVLARLKSICTEFHVPYRYLDLATALNSHARG